MQVLAERYGLETPEKLVIRLVKRLRQHACWDIVLVFLPPLIVGIDCVTTLYRGGWITGAVFIIAALAVVAMALAILMHRYRSALPSMRLVAHLIDERAGATDRFITLSTIEPFSCAPSLLGRLRSEAAGFLPRVRIKQDFPYKVKRSFYRSVLGALVFAAVFHLLLPIAGSRNRTPAVPERLREIAAKMAKRPRLTELARQLQMLAAKMQDVNAAREDKRAAVQEMQRKIEQERNKEEQKDNRDLLGQAASALEGAEQQTGNGQEQQKKSDGGGGGGIQSNLPEKGKGETKSSSGSGDGKGEVTAELSKDMQEGKTSAGDPKEQGKEKNQQKVGEGKGDRPDTGKAEGDKTQEISGKTQGEREDKQGKDKGSEDIPQGAPPAERLSRPGEEGKGGIKGARYVTVQLPEEVAADSKGAISGAKDSKSNRVGPKLPVSNVPLPAHLPDAPTEKQRVPLEYRGIIR
jgi:hypothetical protein